MRKLLQLFKNKFEDRAYANGLDKNTIDVKEVTLIQPFQHLYFQG